MLWKSCTGPVLRGSWRSLRANIREGGTRSPGAISRAMIYTRTAIRGRQVDSGIRCWIGATRNCSENAVKRKSTNFGEPSTHSGEYHSNSRGALQRGVPRPRRSREDPRREKA
jgi:hypothetical protein